MTLKERIKLLCREHGVSMNKLEDGPRIWQGIYQQIRYKQTKCE